MEKYIKRQTVKQVLRDRNNKEITLIKRVNMVIYKGESYGAYMISTFKYYDVKRSYINKRGQFVILVY